MTQSRLDLEAESWAFALRIYARPGVADACLRLQEEAGVDVMMLLMTAFTVVKHRILLTPSEILELDEACRPWREQIVQPIRAVRVKLKSGPLPAPNSETEQFRLKIKAAELAAERLQNRLLAECLPLRPPERDTVPPEDLRSVLRNVVTPALQKRAGSQISDQMSSIDAIVEAAMQDTPG
jgi:uncharacterized protein (TIGR02444 family)